MSNVSLRICYDTPPNRAKLQQTCYTSLARLNNVFDAYKDGFVCIKDR